MKTVHITIQGKVQGVFFRASTKEVADKMHIGGWVKNSPLGHVEIMATGTDEQIDHFVNWCRQGPEMAIVSDVSVLDIPLTTFPGFIISR
jgi:acylphosphatase